MDETAPDPFLGASVGNLVLVAKLGSGGMGTVYRGEHRSLKTPYAVKVLHAQFSESADTVERFRREAVACSQLRHENVVFVTDFGVQEGLGIYIVMEYLEGDSLKQVLRQSGRLPLGRFGRIVEQVCDAMAAAHRLDIVHRDLKPDNIVVLGDKLRRDFIKVLDFGIAHIKGSGDDDLTASGLTVGTPAYIAPEQVMGKADAIGPAADIYSLGVMFFELLSGGLPFARGANDYELLSQHVTAPPPTISVRYPALAGTRMEKLISAMLEKKPEKRPGSMLEVKARVHEAIREMQERGDPEAFYEGEGVPSVIPLAPSGPSRSEPEQSTSPTLHITQLVRQIQRDAPESPAASLLKVLPNADRLGGEAIALALWGVLQQELLDAPLEAERFKQSVKHFGLLMEAVILAHGGSVATESQLKVFRSLKTLMTVASKERQGPLLDAIQNLVHHPVFPRDALPKDKGGWLKGVMQKEIKLWGAEGQKGQIPPPKRPPAEPRAGGPPTDPPFRAHYDKGMNYYLEEKFEEAIKELKAAFFLKAYAPILFTIGGAYRSLGQPADALEHYQRYEQTEPNLGPQARVKLENFIAEAKAQLQERGALPSVASDPGEQVLTLDNEIPALSLSLESDAPAAPRAESKPPSRSAPVAVPTPPPRPAVTSAPPAAPRPAVVSAPPAPPPAPPPEEPAVPPPPSLADIFDAHYARATALCQAGRYEEGIADYTAAYRIEPDPALLFHIAWSYRMMGRPREALHCFLRYQQAEPDLKPEAAARLSALIAEAQGQLQPAPSNPPRAPAPTAPPPVQESPPPEAPPAQAAAPEPAPEPPAPPAPEVPAGTYAEHHARAIGLHKAGSYEEAIKAFLAAYQVRPVAALLFNIAATYRILKRPREALEFFDRFAAAEQDMSEAMQLKLSNLKAEARSQIDAAEGRGANSPFFNK